MAKIGKNKKSCEKYKLSGHKEENKKLKQQRHEKRMARFAKRKEEGKSYVYNKERTAQELEFLNSGADLNYDSIKKEWVPNYRSNQARHTEASKWRSIMRKLSNEVDKEVAKEKAKEAALKKGKK